MRILLIALVAMVFGSCSMQKELHKNTAKQSEKSTTKKDSTDTTKSSSVTEINRTTAYGDTLRGSLYFDELDMVRETRTKADYPSYGTGYINAFDSIESNGVKVVVALERTKTGFRAKVKAIAKAVSMVDHLKKTTTETKGVIVKTVATLEKKNEVSSKDLKKKQDFIVISLMTGLLLIGMAFYLIKKYNILLWLKNL